MKEVESNFERKLTNKFNRQIDKRTTLKVINFARRWSHMSNLRTDLSMTLQK